MFIVNYPPYSLPLFLVSAALKDWDLTQLNPPGDQGSKSITLGYKTKGEFGRADGPNDE